MITAIDLLAHLEAKLDANLSAGAETLQALLQETARIVRQVAEAALVAGDEVTLKEARRLAARLGPFAAPVSAADMAKAKTPRERTCPRCGQQFRGPASPLEQIGRFLCETCTRELLAGIRL